MDDLASDTFDTATDGEAKPGVDPARLNLVKEIQKKVKADKTHHDKAFEKMRRDMHIARYGYEAGYNDTWYSANLAGRHVKQKTALLYAKNPKAVAKRRETLDFTVWDEDPKSLEMAMQTLMMSQQLMAQQPIDPMTGAPTIDENDPTTQQMMQAFQTAQATVADFQQGMERRKQIDKIGKTLEILFAQALREQKPVDFKVGMKQLVRRACTTGVGYVELAFQRTKGPRPEITEKLTDFRARLDHMRVLAEKVSDTENPILPDDAEISELQSSIAALQAEPEVVLREGLIIDFPQSTKVIPDKLCRELVGFIGARHLTIEYMYTPDEVREMFGVDLQGKFKGYTGDGKSDEVQSNVIVDSESAENKPGKANGLVCVWKHYDKTSGLVYLVADGYSDFLREPGPPDVFVEDFWPVYALTFNAVESESELFPPSDVALLRHQQHQYNMSRQGMTEHRKAARPRFSARRGALSDTDKEQLKKAEAFDVIELDLEGNINELMQSIQIPGVDPNLYGTEQYFTDIQLAVGSSEAQFGMTGKATATGEAIAAGASKSSDDSSIDDLDGFLTVIARASSQILLREMSEEQVKAVAGVGAVWPQMSMAQIADEVFLEVEAGSTGKPNQAVEIQNLEKLMPFLLQIPGLNPTWLLKQMLRRMDDKLDVTEALAAGMPSVMAQNSMMQPSTGDPASDPNAQGGEGDDNGPPPDPERGGSDAPMGNNQV